jgi:23S rRNA pseudouridine2604 synthase
MTRINKWLSEMGVCSRKQADRLILEGCVEVNHKPAKLGMNIQESDSVRVNDELISGKPEIKFLLYHKPVGVVCSYQAHQENNLATVLDLSFRVFAVGRLDKDSEGLLLLTNQGDVVNPLMKSKFKQPKIYQVWVDQPLPNEVLETLTQGVEILGQTTLPCQVKRISECCIEMTLVQGLNLQIRRMFKAVGYRVVRLKRISLAGLELGNLAPGEIRSLDKDEIVFLYKTLNCPQPKD